MKEIKIKWIIVILISFTISYDSTCQLNITNTLMSSGSYSAARSKISIANSFGEVFIFSSSNGNIYCNQGFHNSEINVLVATIDIAKRKNSVSIYPNPVQKEIFINSKTEFNQAHIYSFEGLIIQSTFLSKNEPIDVSNLKPGLYIIQLISNQNIKYSGKFLKT